MELGKYKKAMRPKKYLTHDFIVYQDPSYTSVIEGYGSLDTPLEGVEMRIDKQAGGIVQREAFAKGPPNPKGRSEDLLTGRGANDLIDAFIKAHAKDDISFLFQKTAANPNGVLDKEGLKALSKVINNPKGLEKFVEKTKLDADTIYDMLDEREAFKNLDLESAMKKSSTAGTREQIKTTLSNGEDWLIKNSKNYDTVKDLKKGFKRVFGKNHPFLKESLTFTEDNLTKFKPLFFDDIKLTKTPGATPSYKLQKYSLDQIFNASLYNFNPEVRDEVLNDLNDILSQKITSKTKGDIRNQFLKNKRLNELGITKRLQGPITRLLMQDINEDIVENLKFIKQPIRGTPNLLNYLKDKVDPKYRKQFELASKAITQIQAKKYDGAKETLNIAENINFDHKIPQSVIELGYADEIEFAKVNPVGEDFNQNVKRTQFDSKINRLIRVYEATPDKDKPKIIKKMNAVKDSFNKRYNNYLGDISIKQIDGKLNFSSKGKVIKTSADVIKTLQNNFKQNPQLFQVAEASFGGVCRVKKSTGGRVPGEDFDTCIARNLSETLGDAGSADDAKRGKAMGKLMQMTRSAKTVGKGALRGLQSILIGTGPVEIPIALGLEVAAPLYNYFQGEEFETILGSAPLLGYALSKINPEKFSEEAIQKLIYGSGLNEEEMKQAENLVAQLKRYTTMKDLFKQKQSTYDYYQQLIDEGADPTSTTNMMNKKIAELDKLIDKNVEEFGAEENKVTADQIRIMGKGISNAAEEAQFQKEKTFLHKYFYNPAADPMTPRDYIDRKKMSYMDRIFYGDDLGMSAGIRPELRTIQTPEIKDYYGGSMVPTGIQTNFAEGGVVERKGFANGPKITRRGFIGAVAAVIASLKLGSFGGTGKKITTEVGKKVIKNAPDGTPDWFAPLVDKVFKEGVDAGETMKTVTGRETVKKLEVPNAESDGALTDKYYLYQNTDTGEIRIDIDSPGLGANDGEFSLYMRPSRVDGVNDDGTPTIDEGEFFVTEDRVVGRATSPDDYDIDLEPFDTDLEGSASNWHKVEEFATGKTDKKAQAKQLEKKERIEAFPHEDLTDRYGDYDPPDPDDY